MMSLIIPPSIFYTVILPSLDTSKKALVYAMYINQYHDFLIWMIIKFKYGKGNFHNKQYYQTLWNEISQIEQYQRDLEPIIKGK